MSVVLVVVAVIAAIAVLLAIANWRWQRTLAALVRELEAAAGRAGAQGGEAVNLDALGPHLSRATCVPRSATAAGRCRG